MIKYFIRGIKHKIACYMLNHQFRRAERSLWLYYFDGSDHPIELFYATEQNWDDELIDEYLSCIGFDYKTRIHNYRLAFKSLKKNYGKD